MFLNVKSLFVFFFFNVYSFLREREKQSMSGERAGKSKTQNPKQAPGSELSAHGPTRGLNSLTVRS